MSQAVSDIATYRAGWPGVQLECQATYDIFSLCVVAIVFQLLGEAAYYYRLTG